MSIDSTAARRRAPQVVDAARTLPMMVPRRVVLLLHAERLLNPKKDSEASARDLETLEVLRQGAGGHVLPRDRGRGRRQAAVACQAAAVESHGRRMHRSGRCRRSGEMGEGSRGEGRHDDRRARRAARGRSRGPRCVAASRPTSSGWCSTPPGTRRSPKRT